MRKEFYMLLLIAIYSSCSSKEKEAQIMRMSGYVENVFNPKDIRCNKGDTIVLSTCGWHSKFKISIYGIYTGTLPEDLTWYNKDGSVKSICDFEKAVFLREVGR